MDVTIANLHISVHRAEGQPVHGQPVADRIERKLNQAQLIARIEQEREQVRNQAGLHGVR